MTMKPEELEPLKKNALHHAILSPDTKTQIVQADIYKITANIKLQLAKKRNIAIVVYEIKG